MSRPGEITPFVRLRADRSGKLVGLSISIDRLCPIRMENADRGSRPLFPDL